MRTRALAAGLVAGLLGAAVSGARPATADELDLGAVDKQAHVAVSYSLCFTGSVLLGRTRLPRWQALLVASAATLAAGALKELVLDDEPSRADMAANALGVGLGVGLVLVFEL